MSDLFAIHCTTCKTRLRVRDASVIGHILACPKCSSMVLVEAPAGWAPPIAGASTPAPSTSAPSAGAKNTSARVLDPSLKETRSDSDFDEVDAIFSGQGSKPVPSTASKVAESPKKPATAAAENPRDTPAPPPPAEAAATVGALPSPAQPDSPLPDADWTAGRVKRFRLLGMLAAAGSMGVALAIGAAFLAASWTSGNRPKEIAANSAPETTDLLPDTTPITDPPTEVDPSIETSPPTEESRKPIAQEEPPEEPDVAPQKLRDPLNLVDDPSEPPTADPLKLDDLRKLSGLIQDDAGPALIEADSTPNPADAGPPVPLEEPEASPARPRPELRKIDLAARLADRFVELEVPEQSLADVIQFLSDFSTIPITLDPQSLVWSRISPATKITARFTNASVQEVLNEVLKPHRLEARTVGDQIVVARSSAVRSIRLPVGDLAGKEAQPQLIEMIEALAAPSTWKSAGGTGSITAQGDSLLVENTELAYGEVMQVCERLRLARGGRTKSVFPPELFALERRTQRAATKLDLPLTLNFGQPTLLVKILERFAEETGTQITVDWQAAGEAGWPPDADATVTLEKTPLRDALVKLLAPMDLTYRVIDGNTLEVTTQQAQLREPEIEAYDVGDLAASDDEAAGLIDRITASLGNMAVLRYDSPSKSLFALAPQPKQEELAELLDSWRTK